MKRLIFILILLLSATLCGEVDTLQHEDSIYECILSTHFTACCGVDPVGPCAKINLGYNDYWAVGRTGSGIGSKDYPTLYGLHLGGRDTTDLDSVNIVAYCYTDLDNGASLILYANPSLKTIETVTDTLQWRYGHYYSTHCQDDINDSSPTWSYQIRDSADGVGVAWGHAGANSKDIDFDYDIFDSITLNGTSWHSIPITNCVRAAMDSGNTYCDMILREKEFYFCIDPSHSPSGTTDSYMGFRPIDYYQSQYRTMVIFYYADEGTARRRKILSNP